MNLFASAPPCIYIEPPHIAYSLSQTGQHVKHKILPVSKSLFLTGGCYFTHIHVLAFPGMSFTPELSLAESFRFRLTSPTQQ